MTVASKLRRVTALLSASAARAVGLPRGVIFVRPCYWIVGGIRAGEAILDFGLGDNADFSAEMVRRFGVRSFGFEPTRRHLPHLEKVMADLGGRLTFHTAAIGGVRGRATFNESAKNVSGSLLANHQNVLRDRIDRYEVEVLPVADALEFARGHAVALVKVDIEGAEYEALAAASEATLKSVPQWVVEFHHGVVRGVSFRATRDAIRRFRRAGFRVFTTDNVNFLFYHPRAS